MRSGALIALAAVVLALLFGGTASGRPIDGTDDPGPYAEAIENAQRIRELTRPFVIAAVPDTQSYSANGWIGFKKQIEWLLANAAEQNIVFVTHLGDVVDVGDDQAQWANAFGALNPLLRQNWLPFSIIYGNHDDPAYFMKMLPLSLMQTKSWFVAASPSGLSQAQKFKVEQAWFLHIGFGNSPTDTELQWASHLLKRPELRGMPVIVSAHDYLGGHGKSREGWRLWNGFIKDNPMVFMVLCGHIARESAFVDRDAAGLPVYQMLSDYQGVRIYGGNGLMRLITIDPWKDVISVRTFSPYFQYSNGHKPDINHFETDANSQFQYWVAWGFGVNLGQRLAFDTVFGFEGR